MTERKDKKKPGTFTTHTDTANFNAEIAGIVRAFQGNAACVRARNASREGDS